MEIVDAARIVKIESFCEIWLEIDLWGMNRVPTVDFRPRCLDIFQDFFNWSRRNESNHTIRDHFETHEHVFVKMTTNDHDFSIIRFALFRRFERSMWNSLPHRSIFGIFNRGYASHEWFVSKIFSNYLSIFETKNGSNTSDGPYEKGSKGLNGHWCSCSHCNATCKCCILNMCHG